MNKNKSHVSGCGFSIFLVLFWCAPAMAQHAGGLGGSLNDAASGKITHTIIDRVARRRAEKKPGVKPAAKINDASVRFRPTGTQLKTREIANLIDAKNPQVLTILTTILTEFDKGASAAGHPNDLALALSFFFATNASVYHDAGEPADPPLLELRDTIAEALVEDNALNGVTDRQKQEMYETLVIYTEENLSAVQGQWESG